MKTTPSWLINIRIILVLTVFEEWLRLVGSQSMLAQRGCRNNYDWLQLPLDDAVYELHRLGYLVIPVLPFDDLVDLFEVEVRVDHDTVLIFVADNLIAVLVLDFVEFFASFVVLVERFLDKNSLIIFD